jgi:hypothetical protein
MRSTIVAAVLALAPLGHVQAQDRPPLAPNERVRVWRDGATSERIDGRVVAVDGDTLILSIQRFRADAHGRGIIDSVPTSVAMMGIDSVIRHTGRRSAGKRGALFGGISMFLAGAALTATYYESGEEGYGRYVFGGALVTGALGAGIGWLIGSAVKRDQWEEVSLDGFRAGVVPRTNGIGMVATVTF